MVEGFLWVTLTQLKHLYTLLNMIVHLGGEGPSILYKFIVKNPLICTAGVVKPTNTKKNVNPVIIKIEFARFCGASVGEII